MSDVDEKTLATIQRHVRQCKLQNSEKKASFRDVMLSLGKELAGDDIRKLMPVIKKQIEVINAKSVKELEADNEGDEEGLVENEYDELSSSFQKKLEGKDYVTSLIVYGSFGKKSHIMGQSNLNFLLVLKDMDQAEQEKAGAEIKEIIESIMNPLYEYLFDLVVLFDHNVTSIENFKKRMGPGFTLIHAYSASQCNPLIGNNPFKENLTFKIKELNESAGLILNDTLQQFKQSFNDMKAEGDATKEDLAYISSEAIIDYALALIFFHMTKIEHITKPDIRECFSSYFGKNEQFKPYIATVEHSFAFRLGVSKIADSEITDVEIIKKCEKLTKEVELLIK